MVLRSEKFEHNIKGLDETKISRLIAVTLCNRPARFNLLAYHSLDVSDQLDM